MNLNRLAMASAVLAITLVGCGSGTAAVATNTPVAVATPTQRVTPPPRVTLEPTATPDPTATPEPIVTPEPTPEPTVASIYPTSYAALSSRNWARVVKAPDNYTGKGYKLWACISQFDAATGLGAFRGQASYRKEPYWYSDGINTFFNGDEDGLADFLQDDIVAMDVMSLGSYSYDTQNGGNTTVPLFLVMKIKQSGTCEL